MKYTLLQIVQSILTSMGSDEINSISDTLESNDVAIIVRENYNNIISSLNAPEHFSLFELNASGSINRPTVMYKPDGIGTIEWIKYNCITSSGTTPDYNEVKWMDLTSFLNMMYSKDITDSDVSSGTLSSTNTSSIDLIYNNSKGPSYYTTFDDYTLLFDSYDSGVDSTLQKNKTLCYGLTIPTFTLSDSFTPALDDNLFPLLINESKSQAFAEIKQVQNPNAERKARRNWITSQKHKRNVYNNIPQTDLTPDYGRH